MAAILADAISARTTLPWSMPGSCQSAAYSSDPETLSTKSWCAGLCPTTRNASWRAEGLGVESWPPVPSAASAACSSTASRILV